MSLDKSLKSKNMLSRHRNVLTRDERIAILQDVGTMAADGSPWGLPKVSHRKVSVGKKEKKVKKEGDDAATDSAGAASS